MFCNKCGTQLPNGAQFCANCGNQLGGATANQGTVFNVSASKKSNKNLIIILSICLGVLLLIGGGLVAYGMATGIFFGDGSSEVVTFSSEQQNTEQDWEAAKTAYLGKISSYKFPKQSKFIFIDINGDNIQELYMRGPDYATGDMLWTYYDGNVSELHVPNYGLSYFEGENYFMSKQMHMGVGWDNVFSIEEGEFVSHHYGEWTDGTAYPGLKDKYILDGEAMDKSTYELELKHLFDIDGAKKLDSKDPGWMTIDQLRNMLSNTANF